MGEQPQVSAPLIGQCLKPIQSRIGRGQEIRQHRTSHALRHRRLCREETVATHDDLALRITLPEPAVLVEMGQSVIQRDPAIGSALGRTVNRKPDTPDLASEKLIRRTVHRPQRQIGIPARQVEEGRIDDQFDQDARMFLPDISKDRQQRGPHRFRRRQANHTAQIAFCPDQAHLQRRNSFCHAVRRRDDLFARLRGPVAVPVTIEERGAQPFLDLLQPTKHGRGRHLQLRRSEVQRAFLRQGANKLDVIPIHCISAIQNTDIDNFNGQIRNLQRASFFNQGVAR